MDIPKLDLPNQTNVFLTMRQILQEAMKQPLFAVLDGAVFDDLPEMLRAEGIDARSLLHESATVDARRNGPWLVRINDPITLSYIERLDARKHCAVYWLCPEGENALWRHLRTINEVLIPAEGTTQRQSATQPVHYDRVLFRHYDPNVLGAVTSLLTPSQISRFVGPAIPLAFYAPDYGGLKYTEKLTGLQPASPGPLRFEPEQMARLRAVMLHSSRLRIARFLKNHIPPHFEGVDDAFVWGAVLASEQSADELGILTERGRARWAYVMIMSDGKAMEIAEIRDFVRTEGDTPDNRVKSLIDYTVEALRKQGEPS